MTKVRILQSWTFCIQTLLLSVGIFLAICKGRANTGEDLVLFRCNVALNFSIAIRDGSAVSFSILINFSFSSSIDGSILRTRFRLVGHLYLNNLSAFNDIFTAYLLPYRAYSYKKLAWHYFLFDLCYYVTILNFVYIWVFPGSPTLLVACYCLSQGSLASAVITWRNSLVFHDQDKVTSLFVHIYGPFSFTVIRYVFLLWGSAHFTNCFCRHYYPDAEQRFPALRELPHLNPLHALAISGGICK